MQDKRANKFSWVYDLALVLILLLAAALRFTGQDWGEGRQLHPDERFLTDVTSRLQPVGSLAAYFDTANSTLNPNNHGFTFYVYGTLPPILVRYMVEWLQRAGEVQLVGRAFSALADLGVVWLVYLIGARLFDKRTALLATAFSALSVMQIQQSHFWTVDNFVNFFALLTVYFAVRVAAPAAKSPPGFTVWDFVFFGAALGAAMASKASVALVCLTLPLAVLIRVSNMPAAQREQQLVKGALWTGLAALVSLLSFRVLQPYAFLGLGLNPAWVDTMRQLSAQVSGAADWPPSMQWARRAPWFGLRNIVGWGLGWPLAITAWAGFIWHGWRALKGEWLKPPFVVWVWGLVYFVWQSTAFNPTMRYFLPLYPVLALFGAWGVLELWRLGSVRSVKPRGSKARAPRLQRWLRPAAVALAALGVVGGLLWSLAFVQIYRQPVSRVAAARWIYQNAPGPLTLTFSTEAGQTRQPLSLPNNHRIDPDTSVLSTFMARQAGLLTHIDIKNVLAPAHLSLRSGPSLDVLNADHSQVIEFEELVVGELNEIIFPVGANPFSDLGAFYQLQLQLPQGSGQMVVESVQLSNSQNAELPGQTVSTEPLTLYMGGTLLLDFTLDPNAFPDRVVVTLRPETDLQLAPVHLRLRIDATPEFTTPFMEAELQLAPSQDGLAASYQLPQPFMMNQGTLYYLQVSTLSEGPVTLQGSAVANETSWDDGLPLPIDGYDAFGGIYQGGLTFEMYWDENREKVERFENILDQADYLFITSNRQWGSLPRIPERFPLVVAYYQALLGCPDERSIEWCYTLAQPGMFEGQLGFELVEVFENAPQLGGIKINDQAAEEAFTVYDHPKVLIFRKTAAYDPAAVAAILGSVPVEQAIHVTPKEASGRIPPNLMLPADRLQQQRAGGTWAELFDRAALVNISPWISLVVWYLALAVLGVMGYPLVRWALPGLKDGGYPFARLAGLLLLTYLAWMGGSLGLTFSRAWLATFFVILGLLGVLAARPQWAAIKAEWKSQRAMFLRTEILFLGFFVLMLLIRLGNPDLWHPAKGGEKPMDFAYFNAVLKSSSFPPYDPWFAGGYINYYYYGFVLVSSLVKLLGIVPSVAYNLILPSLFAMLGLGAYSVAWNLWTAWRQQGRNAPAPKAESVGLAASVAIVLLGNLGNLHMILQGYTRLGSEGAPLEAVGYFTRLGWMLRGFVLSLSGVSLPYGLGDWYWNPTRIFPGPGESAPITEFPLFTFTYADLHAHMIALPVTLLALGWALSAVLSAAKQRSWLQLAWVFLFGGIVIGSLRPINTWDLPVYALVAAIAVAYAAWRYAPRRKGAAMPPLLQTLAGPLALGLLCYLAYLPFTWWYRQGYSSVRIWDGIHVEFGPYLTHWGIFLFFIVAWLVWETRQWLAGTPLSSVRKLEPYVWLLPFVFLFVLAILLGLHLMGVVVGWLLVPLILWVGLLFLRPGQEEIKRMALFLVGTGLFLTLFVEVIVLQGDISRMNTVFKFYMQAWTLLGIAAALAAAWCWQAQPEWTPRWRGVWQTAGAALLASGALFMLLGVTAKINDRMAAETPHSLDGMEYMQYSVYYERDRMLTLREDYETIRWMQDNIPGSPVIMEGYTSEYRWAGRYAINTGLPAVLGWNHHQRQQREFVPGNDVWARVGDVNLFYETTSLDEARALLARYSVGYIVVGQMERALYSDAGLRKFAAQDGVLWRQVFRTGETTVYEVLPAP